MQWVQLQLLWVDILDMISSSSFDSEIRMVCGRENVSDEERAPLCTPNVLKYSKNLCPWSELGKAGTHLVMLSPGWLWTGFG